MARLLRSLLAIVLGLAFLLARSSTAEAASCASTTTTSEGVPLFAVDVAVNPDATATIRETIRVVTRGQLLGAPIVRELPARYPDASGEVLAIELQDVTLEHDGQPVRVQPIRTAEAWRIPLGQPEAALPPGDHTYTLTYRVVGALHVQPDRDTLVWPVTGPTWPAPIGCTTVSVRLPFGIPASRIQTDGRIGSPGRPGQAVSGAIDPAGFVTYLVSDRIGVDQGLTIVVSWPRGFIHEPPQLGQTLPLLGDESALLAELIGLGVASGYAAFALRRVRRRPQLPPLETPVDRPPDDLSPAGIRYLAISGYDARTLAAALLNLAVRGYLTIHSDGAAGASPGPAHPEGAPTARSGFTLARIESSQPRPLIAPEEGAVLFELLGTRSRLTIGAESGRALRQALAEIRRLIGALHEGRYLATNSLHLIPVSLIIVATVLAVALIERGRASLDPGATILWLIISAALVFLLGMIGGAILLAIRVPNRRHRLAIAGAMGLGSLPPFVAAFLLLAGIARTPALVVGGLGLPGLGLAVFRRLLRTPTLDGYLARARLQAFRAFLQAMPSRVAPAGGSAPHLDDLYLPYLVALDLEETRAGTWQTFPLAAFIEAIEKAMQTAR